MPTKRWVLASTMAWRLSRVEWTLLLEVVLDRREVVIVEGFAQQLPVGRSARCGRESRYGAS